MQLLRWHPVASAIALSMGIAAIIVGATLTTVVLAPRYLSVCPDADGRGCAVTAPVDPSHVKASQDAETSIVALRPGTDTLTLHNEQVTGSASIAVLGWFSAADPSSQESDFGLVTGGSDQTVRVTQGTARVVQVADLPPAARALLIRLTPGETADAAPSPSSSASHVPVATVHISAVEEAVDANEIRGALEDLASRNGASDSAEPTPGGSATPDPGRVDSVIDSVVDQTGGSGGSSPTPRPTASPSPTPSRTPTPTPTAPPVPTPPPAPPAPVPGGAAGAGTTGVPAGTPLTAVQGDVRVTVDGTVLDHLDIHGIVFVDASNVTISNSIIRGADGGSSGALITATGGHPGLTISNTEIFAAVESPNVNGIYGYNFTATRVNIHNVIDMVHLTGGNVVVTNSWFHNNLHYQVDPNQGGSPSHDDSIQIQVGSNIQIRDNNISGAFNSGVQITQNRGSVSNVQFTGNNIDGGGCSFNISEGGNGPVNGVSISNNVFGRDTKVPDCAVIAPGSSVPALSNNHYSNGAVVTLHRG